VEPAPTAVIELLQPYAKTILPTVFNANRKLRVGVPLGIHLDQQRVLPRDTPQPLEQLALQGATDYSILTHHTSKQRPFKVMENCGYAP